jgi:beta-lactamase regulating signal transducer with metallopeptidase domain
MSPDTLSAIDLVVRVTLLLGAGMMTAFLVRRRAASVRHLALSASLGGTLVLALLVPWAPRLDVPIRKWQSEISPRGARLLRDARGFKTLVFESDSKVTSPVTVSSASSMEAGLAADSLTLSGITTFGGPDRPPLWLIAWVAGALITLGWGLSGRAGLALLVRRATLVTGGPWRQIVDETSARMGTSRPVSIYLSSRVGAPMTWGAIRPVLMVPVESDGWTDELKRSVAAHELAHVMRNDYLLQLMAMVTCAIYWFNPLVWMTSHRMRQAAERACDDQVLKLGTPGEEYAAHLIGVARVSTNLRLSGAVAIGMARPSTLEGRIVDVLDTDRARGEAAPRTRKAIVAAATMVLVLVGGVEPVPAATPVDDEITTVRTPDSVSERVADFVADSMAPVADSMHETEPPVLTPSPPPSRNVTQGRDSAFERSFSARPGGTLILDLNTGAGVTVRGWDEDRVVVRARLAGPSWRDVDVDIERESDGVRIGTDFVRRSGNHSTSNEFEVRVPRRYDVRLKSAGGGLRLIDLDGRFSGNTGGGEIIIERAKGSARLNTGGGEIKVTDSDLSGTVSTGGGTVVLSRVSGGLRGSSGSGPVIYGESSSRDEGRRSTTATADLSSVEVRRDGSRITVGGEPPHSDYRGGVLHIDKAGGDINLNAAPDGARISTGGGDVTVGPSEGDIVASTGGGDVTIGPATSSVRAGTGAGEVRIVVDRLQTRNQVIEATSGKGRIIIELPSDFGGRLDLETAHTRTHEETARIRSDWDLEREPLTDWDARQGTPRRFLRASAVIGRGNARVIVRTVNGEIEIRRR